MAIITPASTFLFGDGCAMGQQRYDLVGASDSTGSEQVRLLAPPRWTLSLVQPDYTKLSTGEAGLWQALLLKLRGRANVLACWDPVASAPLGTMRGTQTLGASLAAGATTAVIAGGAGQAGRTYLPGDKVQIGTGLGTSQLVMITDPATANGSGNITVSFEPPVRDAYASGTAVTWDKPLAYFRARGQSNVWKYGRRGTVATGMALDLLETWTS